MVTRRQERTAFTLAALCGAAWIGTLVLARPTRGKDWRGYEGVVQLAPSVVYRFTLEAPFDTDPSRDMTRAAQQALVRQALEGVGARAIELRVGDRGVLLEFEQSFSGPRQLDFGAPAFGPFRPLVARRLDGLDWEAP